MRLAGVLLFFFSLIFSLSAQAGGAFNDTFSCRGLYYSGDRSYFFVVGKGDGGTQALCRSQKDGSLWYLSSEDRSVGSLSASFLGGCLSGGATRFTIDAPRTTDAKLITQTIDQRLKQKCYAEVLGTSTGEIGKKSDPSGGRWGLSLGLGIGAYAVTASDIEGHMTSKIHLRRIIAGKKPPTTPSNDSASLLSDSRTTDRASKSWNPIQEVSRRIFEGKGNGAASSAN